MASPEKQEHGFELTDEQLRQIVAEADTGGRKRPDGRRASSCWSHWHGP